MEEISLKIYENQFRQRAGILYYARIFLLFIGFSIVVFPDLREKFSINGPFPYIIFFFMLSYSVINYYIKPFKILKIFTFITLLFDLSVFAVLIVISGGLNSPILSTQIVYLIFFTTLFQKPLLLLPPLLILPVITRVDLILGNNISIQESIFTIVWFSSLNIIIVYFIVLLNNKTTQNALNIYKFQQEVKEKHLLEEKNKIARDLHDGVGGGLSSLILQAEYIISIAQGNVTDEILEEIKELKLYAEESMEEIRRSLSVIKDSFDLKNAILDYLDNFKDKNRIKINQNIEISKIKLIVKDKLSVFRVFQEILTNALKHSKSQIFDLTIKVNISEIFIELKDHGVGFDFNKEYIGHFGLKNLKERVGLLKGSIEMSYNKNDGTIIKIKIPNIENDTFKVDLELF
jgi:signal transduction histidine kinase